MAAALVGTVCTSALAAPGDLDRTFGGDGRVTTRWLSRDSSASSVALQANGKLVVAGSAGRRVALARLKTDGTLDRRFAGDGKKTSTFASGAMGVAIQADGRIVVASGSVPVLALARFNADGTFDRTFGGDGIVKTTVPLCPSCFSPDGFLTGLAIQPDGRIVVAGLVGDPENEVSYILLARYLTDGTLDAGFGEGGYVMADVAGQHVIVYSIALQADGKIVVAGETGEEAYDRPDFLLARFDVDGTFDPTFGGNGWVTTDLGDDDIAYDLVVQRDGAIVAVGQRSRSMAMARYLPDGTLDSAFGAGGTVVTKFDTRALVVNAFYGVALQATGKIVVVGRADGRFAAAHGRFAVGRYNADGSPDTTFSRNGRAMTRFAGGGRFDRPNDVVVQANGRIVAAGWAGGRAALARYRAG
jgi:uncharacterized delta-60 repeat protein